MLDLTAVYDQLCAIVWRDGMPASAHAQHADQIGRGYHQHCPICNGDLMRVLEEAELLLARLGRERAARDVAVIPAFDPIEHATCLQRREAVYVAQTGEPWTWAVEDDLDAFIAEQRATDPAFREAYDRLEGSGG